MNTHEATISTCEYVIYQIENGVDPDIILVGLEAMISHHKQCLKRREDLPEIGKEQAL